MILLVLCDYAFVFNFSEGLCAMHLGVFIFLGYIDILCLLYSIWCLRNVVMEEKLAY